MSVTKIIDEEKLFENVSDREFVGKALDEAKRFHNNQKRLDGSPFILHPYRTAMELSSWGMDDTTVVSGLLHDLIEDTSVTKGYIEENFGVKVAEIVEALTKIKELPSSSKDVENLRQLIMAMSRDVRVIIVRLADKLDNLRTVEFLDTERRKSFSSGILNVYAPLAHRIGMNVLKNELEDRAFRELEPTRYRAIQEKLAQLHPRSFQTIKKVKEKLEDIFRRQNTGILRIKDRIKSPLSVFRKMEKQNIDIKDIEDIAAVRIITSDVKDCYAALAVLHETYAPVEGSFTDYISYPKINMYQSIHTTCITESGEKVEFQIRTGDMDKTCEFGVAAHFQYKDKDAESKSAKGLKEWLKNFYEWQTEKLSREEFLENLKTELNYEEIFILTPKSDVKRLIKGATAIDFAYVIHSDVGDKFRGCLVNGKMKTMDYVLKSGERVEILTSKKSHPTSGWLKIAKSPRTKYKIRHWLKTHSNPLATAKRPS